MIDLDGDGFNPRARVGRDGATPSASAAMPTFQSTRPRRARPAGPAGVRHVPGVSIHAPA